MIPSLRLTLLLLLLLPTNAPLLALRVSGAQSQSSLSSETSSEEIPRNSIPQKSALSRSTAVPSGIGKLF